MSLRPFAILLMCLIAGPVAAHTLSVAHVDVTAQGDQGVTLEVDIALRDLALTTPLDLNGDNKITWGELQSRETALQQLVQEGVSLTSGSGQCTLEPGRLGIRSYDGVNYASVSFNSTCNAALGMAVDYRLIFEQDPAHRVILAWRIGERVQTDILQASASTARLRSTQANRGKDTFLQFLSEGIHHILGGIDHLAFLLALLLPAVLLRKGGKWEPAPRVTDSVKAVAGVVTAFTLAHSVTLSLAALGIIKPSGQLVEIVIALSVLAAALNNIRPIVTGRVWLVALIFGLIHGLGFAGALRDLGLPKGQELLALIGFNLGVEIGQLGVVLLVVPALALMRRYAWYSRWVMPALSALIAIAALYWIVQRLPG